MEVVEIVKKTKDVAKTINLASTEKKDEILRYIKENLIDKAEEILKANEKDVEKAKQQGLGNLVDRLSLNFDRIKIMAKAVEDVINLKDPVNEIIYGYTVKNGLKIENIRVPLGVVGIIYESRPNVTLDTAILSIKAGNAVILRGGKEAIKTNNAIVGLIKDALKKADMSPNIIGFIEDISHQSCLQLMKLNNLIDVLIPRGGKNLIRAVVENATVPVIETGVGNCHIYVDEFADLKMALKIVVNAKTSRTSVCNAAESLVVHEKVAVSFLNDLEKEFSKRGVELFGCEKTLKILKNIKPATEEDFYCEYLDLKMSIKIVGSLEEAIDHIEKYSSKHSESIVTNNYTVAEKFLNSVDSAVLYVNASTRFTDGAEFGLGAEIGISTQKLHAKGPMGLKALTTNKFIVRGSGQIRE